MSNERLLTEEQVEAIGTALFKRFNRLPTYGEVAQETAARVREETLAEVWADMQAHGVDDHGSLVWVEVATWEGYPEHFKAHYLAPGKEEGRS